MTSQPAADSAWWRTFSDSTLEQLIHLAYRQNLPLQVAGLRIMESRARLALAVGRKWPQFQVASGQATAIGISENVANTQGFDKDFWDFQLGFDAFWEADFWDKYGSGVRSDAANYYGSIADYDNALVTLTAEVARTYAVIRTVEVLIDQARQNVTLQEEGLRIANSRFRNGATSELDVAQATILLESTRATIPGLQLSLRQAQNALNTLLGRPPGSVEPLLTASRGIPSPPSTVAVGVPADMLRRRPDIRGAEMAANAQIARIGMAKADLYPSFGLAGSIGLHSTNASNGVGGAGTFFDLGSVFYAFGPRIIWNILNYGRLENAVRIEDARFQQSLVDYRNTVLKAAQEVDDELAGFLRSQEVAAFEESAVAGARRSVELSFVQYREGAVDFQRVLDSQRSLLTEEHNLTQARSAVVTHLIAAYKALGGGWQLRLGESFIDQATQDEMRQRVNWGDLLSKPPGQKPPGPPPPR